MGIKELRYFRAVVDLGTFSKAGAHLRIAQPGAHHKPWATGGVMDGGGRKANEPFFARLTFNVPLPTFTAESR